MGACCVPTLRVGRRECAQLAHPWWHPSSRCPRAETHQCYRGLLGPAGLSERTWLWAHFPGQLLSVFLPCGIASALGCSLQGAQDISLCQFICFPP